MLISQDGNSIWGKDDIVSIYIKKTEKGYSVIVLTRDYEERLANYSTEKVAKQELRFIANWKSRGYAQSYEMSQEKDGELI